MRRTTISLPGDLLTRAKVRAAERGISMGELIRRAIEAEVGERPEPRSRGVSEPTAPAYPARSDVLGYPGARGASRRREGVRAPKPRSLGIGASGHTTTSQEASDWPYEPRTWRSS